MDKFLFSATLGVYCIMLRRKKMSSGTSSNNNKPQRNVLGISGLSSLQQQIITKLTTSADFPLLDWPPKTNSTSEIIKIADAHAHLLQMAVGKSYKEIKQELQKQGSGKLSAKEYKQRFDKDNKNYQRDIIAVLVNAKYGTNYELDDTWKGKVVVEIRGRVVTHLEQPSIGRILHDFFDSMELRIKDDRLQSLLTNFVDKVDSFGSSTPPSPKEDNEKLCDDFLSAKLGELNVCVSRHSCYGNFSRAEDFQTAEFDCLLHIDNEVQVVIEMKRTASPMGFRREKSDFVKKVQGLREARKLQENGKTPFKGKVEKDEAAIAMLRLAPGGPVPILYLCSQLNESSVKMNRQNMTNKYIKQHLVQMLPYMRISDDTFFPRLQVDLSGEDDDLRELKGELEKVQDMLEIDNEDFKDFPFAGIVGGINEVNG